MKISNKVFLITVFLTILLLVGLYFFDKLIGGNATNGKIENNICYVQDSCGNLSEVSKTVFVLNYSYTCLTTLFIILGTISLSVLQYKFVNFCKLHKGNFDNLI